MLKKLSLTRRTLISVNVISLALLFGLSTYIVSHVRKNAEEALNGKMSTLTKFLQRSSGNLVWNFDVAGLDRFAEDLKEDDDVLFVNFYDKDGKALSKVATTTHPAPLFRKEPILSPKDGSSIGIVELAYKIDSVDRIVRNTSYAIYIAAVLIVLAIGIALYLFVGRASRRIEAQLEQMRDTAAASLATSDAMKDVSKDLSQRGSSQAAAIEETSATLTQIASIVKFNADNADIASKEATNSYNSAQTGQKEIASLIAAMNDISTSAKKIQEITGVVDDIAFQTNLLALNAAVEAARAGEQGKGFAVVAEAVRALAHRSALAAKDISHMIKESAGKIQLGSTLVETNQKVLLEIVGSAEKVKDLNHQIAASSAEQSAGVTQITRAMGDIDLAVNEIAKTSEDASNQADRLAEQSQQLDQIIISFETELLGSIKSEAKMENRAS